MVGDEQAAPSVRTVDLQRIRGRIRSGSSVSGSVNRTPGNPTGTVPGRRKWGPEEDITDAASPLRASEEARSASRSRVRALRRVQGGRSREGCRRARGSVSVNTERQLRCPASDWEEPGAGRPRGLREKDEGVSSNDELDAVLRLVAVEHE